MNHQEKPAAGNAAAGSHLPASAPHKAGALTENDEKMAALQRQMDAAIESSGFLPLMGTFQEYLETERTRQSRRMTALTFLFVVVLALFLIGPVYLGSVFLQRAEEAFARDHENYEQFTEAVQSGLATLSQATLELKEALEAQKAWQAAQPAVPAVAATTNAPGAPAPTGLVVPPVATPGPRPPVALAPPAISAGGAPTTTGAVGIAATAPAPAKKPVRSAAQQERLMQIVNEIEATISALDRERAAVTGSVKSAGAPAATPSR